MFDHLPRPLLFAHRGASIEAPENTLEAFDIALKLGAHVLELDVQESRDGHVMVIHDSDLDRTTDGTGPVNARTLRELKGLDAGFRFKDIRGHTRYRGRGVRIPTLPELLDSFPAATFNIEVKADSERLVDAVLETVSTLPAERVLLAAGQEITMKKLEAREPGFPLGMSHRGIRTVLQRIWTGRKIPSRFQGRALQIPPRRGLLPVATRTLISAARRAELEVHLWTLNDPYEARAWFEREVDGIMTDDPAAIRPIMDRV